MITCIYAYSLLLFINQFVIKYNYQYIKKEQNEIS